MPLSVASLMVQNVAHLIPTHRHVGGSAGSGTLYWPDKIMIVYMWKNFSFYLRGDTASTLQSPTAKWGLVK